MSPPTPQPETSERTSPFGRRMLIWTIVAVLATPVFFLGVRAVSAWRSGYSWAEMDWDGSGETSLADFLRAAEIGKRAVNVNGAACAEYFSHRDGRVVKTDCLAR